MHPFEKGYLKVLTPQTVDGNILDYTDDGKVKYRESHLDLKAEKRMLEQNTTLPKHLQHIIEKVYPTMENKKPEKRPVVAKKLESKPALAEADDEV